MFAIRYINFPLVLLVFITLIIISGRCNINLLNYQSVYVAHPRNSRFYILSNALHSSIGQNIKSFAVSDVRCPMSDSEHVDNNE